MVAQSNIPPLTPDEHVWRVSEQVEQGCNKKGDWRRVTDGNIEETSTERKIEALFNDQTFLDEIRQVLNHSVEQVDGIKKIVALGAMRLLTAGSCNLSAGDNLSLTSASDIQTVAANDQRTSVGGNMTTSTAGNMTETIEQVRQSLAKAKQIIQVANGGKIWLGDESTNVLTILGDVIEAVSTLAQVCALHTHPGIGPSQQAAQFIQAKTQVDELKSQLDPLIE